MSERYNTTGEGWTDRSAPMGSSGADVEHLEREVHTRRSRLGETMHTVRDRLSPRHMGRGLAEGMSGTGSAIAGAVRNNPVPMALIGAGIGWLLLSRSGVDDRLARSRHARQAGGAVRRAGQGIAEGVTQAGDGVSRAAETAYDGVSRAAETAYDVARDGLHTAADGLQAGWEHAAHASGDLAAGVGRPLRRAARGFWEMAEEHPLVAGVMTLALGAAVGAGIPGSRYEDRLVGDYSDEAYERAKEMAREAVNRGGRAAQAAAEAAAADLSHAVHDVKHAAGDAAAAAKAELDRS